MESLPPYSLLLGSHKLLPYEDPAENVNEPLIFIPSFAFTIPGLGKFMKAIDSARSRTWIFLHWNGTFLSETTSVIRNPSHLHKPTQVALFYGAFTLPLLVLEH